MVYFVERRGYSLTVVPIIFVNVYVIYRACPSKTVSRWTFNESYYPYRVARRRRNIHLIRKAAR